MGAVILNIKIFADGIESLEKVKSSLEKLNPNKIEEEPIAFGMKAFIISITIPDEGGEQDKMEEKLRSIEGVSEIEIISASRAM